MEHLPEDTQVEIIQHLNLRSIHTLCATSKYFQNLCEKQRVKNIIKEKKDSVYLFKIPIKNFILLSKKDLQDLQDLQPHILKVLINKENMFFFVDNEKSFPHYIDYKRYPYKGESYLVSEFKNGKWVEYLTPAIKINSIYRNIDRFSSMTKIIPNRLIAVIKSLKQLG